MTPEQQRNDSDILERMKHAGTDRSIVRGLALLAAGADREESRAFCNAELAKAGLPPLP